MDRSRVCHVIDEDVGNIGGLALSIPPVLMPNAFSDTPMLFSLEDNVSTEVPALAPVELKNSTVRRSVTGLQSYRQV